MPHRSSDAELSESLHFTALHSSLPNLTITANQGQVRDDYRQQYPATQVMDPKSDPLSSDFPPVFARYDTT